MVNDSWQYSETELKARWGNTLAFKGLFDQLQFLDLYQYMQGTGTRLPARTGRLVQKDLLESPLWRDDFSGEQYAYTP